jgi:hypothetical protein
MESIMKIRYKIYSIDLMFSSSITLSLMLGYFCILIFSQYSQGQEDGLIIFFAAFFLPIIQFLLNIFLQYRYTKYAWRKSKIYTFNIVHLTNYIYMYKLSELEQQLFGKILLIFFAVGLTIGIILYQRILKYFVVSPEKEWRIVNMKKLKRDWIRLLYYFLFVLIIFLVCVFKILFL